MNRENAIKYLDRKGKIEVEKRNFSEEDQKKIEEVCKEGKIYGDPVAEVQ